MSENSGYIPRPSFFCAPCGRWFWKGWTLRRHQELRQHADAA